MGGLRRQNVGTEVRHAMSRHPGVVAVLRVPSASEVFAWAGTDLPRGLEEVVHGVVRLEGADDAAAFGAPGSAERLAYVDAMDLRDIWELTRAVSALGTLAEGEAKN
jgi:hypothetical protein